MYTDVLLGAAEIADQLDTHTPLASDVFFRVSDPRVMDLVQVPEEVTDVTGYHPTINAVTFRSIVHCSHDRMYTSSTVALEFAEYPDVLLEEHENMFTAVFENDNNPPRQITPSSVSAIIARLTHPSSDPRFSNFRNINDSHTVREITETLENDDTVSKIIEKMYSIDDQYRVLVERNNSRLTSCEITELHEGDRMPITLTVEFNNFSTASNLYQSTAEGSRNLIIDEGDLSHFVAIIQQLKSILEPDTAPDSRLDENGFDSPDAGA